MKKTINTSIALLPVLIIALALAFSSCQKDSDGSPEVKPGNPVLTSVAPAAAQGGELVTVLGTGLGDMRAVIFEKDSVPTYLNPTLNTETSVLFRVPADAFGGDQNIILINSEGKVLNVPFNVLAFPIVTSVSNYDFEAGTQITLTGNNLNDVTSVKLTGTADAATIVSQTRKEMVIEMPSTSIVRGTLDITNVTGLTKTNQEFICITNTFIMYTDAWGPGAFNGGVQSWSWGCNVGETSAFMKTGTKSLKVDYADGGLSLFLGSDTWEDGHWFTDYYQATYLVFWAYCEAGVALRIVPDSPPWSDFATGQKIVDIPKATWTYVKVPLADFIGGSKMFGRLDIVINGSTGKTVYFDDLIFVE
jgi:hypothetical protein